MFGRKKHYLPQSRGGGVKLGLLLVDLEDTDILKFQRVITKLQERIKELEKVATHITLELNVTNDDDEEK